MFRLDDEVGEGASHRIDHDPCHRAAGPSLHDAAAPIVNVVSVIPASLVGQDPTGAPKPPGDPDRASTPVLPAAEVDIPAIDHFVAVDHVQGVVVRHGGVDVCREHPYPVADPQR